MQKKPGSSTRHRKNRAGTSRTLHRQRADDAAAHAGAAARAEQADDEQRDERVVRHPAVRTTAARRFVPGQPAPNPALPR